MSNISSVEAESGRQFLHMAIQEASSSPFHDLTPGNAYLVRAAMPLLQERGILRLRKCTPLLRATRLSAPLRPFPSSNETDPELFRFFVRMFQDRHPALVIEAGAALAAEFVQRAFSDCVLGQFSFWSRPSDVLAMLRAIPTVALDAGGVAIFSAILSIVRRREAHTVLPNLRELFAIADDSSGRQRRQDQQWCTASRCPHVAAFVLCELQSSHTSSPALFREALLTEEAEGGSLGLGRAFGCNNNRNLVAVFGRYCMTDQAQAAGLFDWLRGRISAGDDAHVDWFVCETVLDILRRGGPSGTKNVGPVVQFLRALVGIIGYSFATVVPPGLLRYERYGPPCATWGLFFTALNSLEILRVVHQECDVDLTRVLDDGGVLDDPSRNLAQLDPCVVEYIREEGQWGGGGGYAAAIKPALRRPSVVVVS